MKAIMILIMLTISSVSFASSERLAASLSDALEQSLEDVDKSLEVVQQEEDRRVAGWNKSEQQTLTYEAGVTIDNVSKNMHFTSEDEELLSEGESIIDEGLINDLHDM